MRIVLFVCLLLATAVLAQAALQPYQQRALEQILATMDPQVQAMMRPQLEQTLAILSESQVEMMLASMAEDGTSDGDDDSTAASDAAPVMSDEDRAWNRSQYEPALRSAWAADKAFDDFVDSRLQSSCPASGSYAVWGQAWRFEVMPFAPSWSRSSDTVDSYVQILGESYAPQDGRYRFDFPNFSKGFDREVVASSIGKACDDYRRIGEEFMTAAEQQVSDSTLQAGPAIENRANGLAAKVQQELESVLLQHAPDAKSAVLLAMINGQRLNQLAQQ